MAFDIDSFDNVSSGASKGPRLWSYGSDTDSLATISASGYFNDVKFRIDRNDLIYVSASDGVEQLRVTSENGQTVTTSVYTSSSGGSGVFSKVSIAITPDEMKNDIAGDGVLLLESQGVNTMIIPVSIVYEYVYNSVPYASGGTVQLSYNVEGSWYASTGVSAGDFTATGDSIIQDVCVFQGPYASSENAVNQAIYVSSPTAFTNGDSTVNVHMTYQVLTTVT